MKRSRVGPGQFPGVHTASRMTTWRQPALGTRGDWDCGPSHRGLASPTTHRRHRPRRSAAILIMEDAANRTVGLCTPVSCARKLMLRSPVQGRGCHQERVTEVGHLGHHLVGGDLSNSIFWNFALPKYHDILYFIYIMMSA